MNSTEGRKVDKNYHIISLYNLHYEFTNYGHEHERNPKIMSLALKPGLRCSRDRF